jgi:hypothetical protein
MEIDELITMANDGKLKTIGHSWYSKCFDAGDGKVLLKKPILCDKRARRVDAINELADEGFPVAKIHDQKIGYGGGQPFKHELFQVLAFHGWELMEKIGGKTLYCDYTKNYRLFESVPVGIDLEKKCTLNQFEQKFAEYEGQVNEFIDNGKRLNAFDETVYDDFIRNAKHIAKDTDLSIDWSPDNFKIDDSGFKFIDLEHKYDCNYKEPLYGFAKGVNAAVFPLAPMVKIAGYTGSSAIFGGFLGQFLPRDKMFEARNLYNSIDEKVVKAMHGNEFHDVVPGAHVSGCAARCDSLRTMDDAKQYLWERCQ